MRDVGALTLAYVFVLTVAAVTMDRLMIRTALIANLVFTIPHFIFHTTHLDQHSVADAVGQSLLLGVGVVVPGLLLMMLRARATPASKPEAETPG
jgi:hypothetical protein